MKNRSKHLFGLAFAEGLPDIELGHLSEWARKEIRRYVSFSPSGEVSEAKLVLSGLIWVVSSSARLLMLARGTVCDSKRDALMWLAHEYVDIRELISLLLSDFDKSDVEPISITSAQSVTLRRFVLKLLIQESESPS
jgi:hypothetical protein